MTTIWLQPPTPGSAPIEVEYTKAKIVPLMVQGHRQIPAPAAPSSPAQAAAPQPLPSISTAKVWLKPPDGGKPIEVQAVPDIVTPYMQKGYTEVPAPAA